MHEPARDDDGGSGSGRWGRPSGTGKSPPLGRAPGGATEAASILSRGAAPDASAPTAHKEEIVVPLSSPRERLRPVAQFRSTMLTTSLKAIRDRGYEGRYLAVLPARYHDDVRACFAGMWLPIELGLAHYDACDALGLSAQEQLAIGKEVGLKIQGTFLGTMVKLAKAAGVTPWLCLSQYQRLYDRLFVGGGVIVTRLGPKEARVEGLRLPLSRIPYFRTAFRGLNEASCELFCTKAYVEEIKKLCTPESIGLRISWA
jgi:hypothetical protein